VIHGDVDPGGDDSRQGAAFDSGPGAWPGRGRAANGESRRGRGDAPEGRVPPHDLGAEKAVLSALLLDNRAMHEVATELRGEDFYHPAHQSLYGAMVALNDQQQPIDLITLADHLASQKLLEAVGGEVYLAELADFEATAAHAGHHARIVHDKAVKRGLIRVATEIVEEGYTEGGPSEQLLDFAESRIFDLSKEKGRTTFRSLHDELPGTFDYVESIMNRGGGLTGVPTGFDELDKMTGGLQPGELIILAARPSMGKTALALNVARNAAIDHGKKVAIFSLEMTTRALVLRLLSSEAQVDFSVFRSSYLPTRDYKRLTQAGDALSRSDIWIDDSGDLTVLEIKSKCRRLHSERGLDLVFVDYLQLAHADGKRRDRKDLEIAEISKGLKSLAKELQIPVVALSQLNRGPEQRDPDKRRPILGDLRESGAIEQDADVIAFIYRDVVYNRDTEHPDLAELNIEKQRNGPIGRVNLHFEGRFARFRDYTGRDDESFLGEPPAGGFVGPDATPPSEPGGAFDAGYMDQEF
jgi:replicative DNA helicase